MIKNNDAFSTLKIVRDRLEVLMGETYARLEANENRVDNPRGAFDWGYLEALNEVYGFIEAYEISLTTMED